MSHFVHRRFFTTHKTLGCKQTHFQALLTRTKTSGHRVSGPKFNSKCLRALCFNTSTPVKLASYNRKSCSCTTATKRHQDKTSSLFQTGSNHLQGQLRSCLTRIARPPDSTLSCTEMARSFTVHEIGCNTCSLFCLQEMNLPV